jgi:hypothetical protein
MKKNLIILSVISMITFFSACESLDVPPLNIIQDDVVFSSSENVQLYLARIYRDMPVQDFRYSIRRGFENPDIQAFTGGETGEALSRQGDGYADEFYGGSADDFYNKQYAQIRNVNYFMETLPKYSSNYSESDLKTYIAEGRFIRAYSYFALVKRFGGVPIYIETEKVTGGDPESYARPRNSEEEVWDLIASDLDYAINDLPEKNIRGRVNKYVAAALKSRAMLHAGCIAKYNDIQQFDGGKRLQGIPSEKAQTYFQAAYDASLILEGKYSLYMSKWKEGDRNAQQENFKQLFFDKTSTENIFVKDYYYPDFIHSYDANMVPRQFQGPDGYSSMMSPTLDFVQMFDGLPKDDNGKITGVDANNKYILYDKLSDFFKNAEPRLLATVITPESNFKGKGVEIYLGIYTGEIPSDGLSKLTDPDNFQPYSEFGGNLKMTKQGTDPVMVTLPDGSQKKASGASGPFLSDNSSSMTGFSIRKYLNESLEVPQVRMSTQSFIDIRFAEVLLNRAEAAYELGKIREAYDAIILIQKRAGAIITPTLNDLTLDVIRKERRKELAFENNIYFDLKRWRIMQVEMDRRYFYGFNPIYSSIKGKWFFDKKAVNRHYNMQESKNYYQRIPGGAMGKNKLLIQNFGY